MEQDRGGEHRNGISLKTLEKLEFNIRRQN
jgi:hypothetical protein